MSTFVESCGRKPKSGVADDGRACIRGMRVTVGMIVGQIGAGHSIEAVLDDYPYLERDDILQALRYASWRAEEREVDLVHYSHAVASRA
ncbi:MAG: DUF433 domain-containing protein [Spirochaetales bacterium]